MGEGLLIGAGLLLAGVLLSKPSARFGVPSLLVFMFLGMLAGSEGIGGIEFADVDLAQQVGVVALAFILFNGGLGTEWESVRDVLAPGFLLASVGVVITAVAMGALATFVLGLPWLEALLLGSIVAATDAAAVFSVLRSRGIALRGRLGPLLELESASNDPAAVFMTVSVISVIEGTAGGAVGLSVSFVQQLVLGVLAGWLLARLAVWLMNRLHLEYEGLYPVLTVAFVVVIFETTALAGGSGFLAVYVAGLTLAGAPFIHKGSLARFHDALGWLMQIGMFVVFGLLVFPTDLPDVAGDALLVAGLLVFVARPLAVAATLLPYRLPLRELVFVSWVGLRGATPIILATFPLVEGVPDADTIFNVVFFVVLTSLLLQGATVRTMARWLGVVDPTAAPPRRFQAVLSADADRNLGEITIPRDAAVAGRSVVEIGLPRSVLMVLLHREDVVLVPQGGTVLREGDVVLVASETQEDYDSARAILQQAEGAR